MLSAIVCVLLYYFTMLTIIIYVFVKFITFLLQLNM